MQDNPLLNFFKKILNIIKSFIIKLIIYFKNLFKKEKKVIDSKSLDASGNKQKNIKIPTDESTLPDTQKTSNANNNNIDNENDIILQLNNKDLKNLKNNIKENKVIFSNEELDKIVANIMEKECHILKIETTNDKVKNDLKNIKVKATSMVKKEITYKEITSIETVKNIAKKTVKQLLNTMSKNKYTIVTTNNRKINIKDSNKPKIKKENKIITDNEKKVSKNIKSKSLFPLKTDEIIPKPKVKEGIPKPILTPSLTTTKTKNESLENTNITKEKNAIPKEEVKQETPIQSTINITNKQPISKDNHPTKDINDTLNKIKEEFEEIKNEIDNKNKSNNLQSEEIIIDNNKPAHYDTEKQLEEETTEEQLEKELTEEQKDINNTEKKQEEKEPDNKNDNSEKNDKEINDIIIISNEVIIGSEEETKKEEFEDKNYDYYEKRIDQMIDEITATYLKYEDKLSDKQKARLKKEEEQLRNAKTSLKMQKAKDIENEQKSLDDAILISELEGLQMELEKRHFENQIELNEKLFGKIENLENMTQEQIANMDKKLLMKRLDKASILLEMSSILAFPFIRNKYFFYFTVGLIINNHFNFINAFFKRKINRYEPADLSQIKIGEDALNSALNTTYTNLVELEYIEQEAISKYPELQNDPNFINRINTLKSQLDKNYKKLMKKKETMEKYRKKTKSQIKVLERKEVSNNTIAA